VGLTEDWGKAQGIKVKKGLFGEIALAIKKDGRGRGGLCLDD
jgi:hypothetical protein